MVEVGLGEGELPFGLERFGAIRVVGELLAKQPAHGGWVRMDLEEHAGAAKGFHGMKAVVTVANQAGTGASGETASGTAEGTVGGAVETAAPRVRQAADTLGEQCAETMKEQGVDAAWGKAGGAALREGAGQSGGEAGQKASMRGIRSPEKIGDESFQEIVLGEAEGELVAIARAGVDGHGAMVRGR